MPYRFVMWLLIALGAVLLGLAAVGSREEPAAGVTVTPLETFLPAAAAGKTVTVPVRIHNPANRPARAVGLAAC
jgi:hypothetical protein